MSEASGLPVAEEPPVAAGAAIPAAAPPPRSPLRRLQAFDGAPPEHATEELDNPLQPQIGDRIMVVRQTWLELILNGTKTMELRGRKHGTGHAWLGSGGCIHGRVKIVQAVPLTEEELKARQIEHQWPLDTELPYKTVYGLMLEEVKQLPEPLSYWKPRRGPIGWNIYRREATDAPMKTSRGGPAKRPAMPDEENTDAEDL